MLFAIPFAVSLAAYWATMCPGLYTGDSGELAFAIYTMGISHPPGYPLLTFLGKTFLALLPGNTAYLLNLLSALLAAASVGIAAHVLRIILFPLDQRRATRALVVSGVLSLLLTFSNALWGTAVGLEVYSLGMLLILLGLWGILKFMETPQIKFILLAIYCAALGMANHLSVAILFLPIVYVMITKRVSPQVWFWGAGLVVLALAAYLYIPLRSIHDPIADWDHPANLTALYRHLTAHRYQSLISGFRPDNYLENLWRSVVIIAGQIPLWIITLGAVGLFVSKRLKPSIRLIALLVIVFNLLAAALYDIPDIEQYYLPTIFILIVGLGGFLLWLFEAVLRNEKAALAGVVILALLTFGVNRTRNDQSENDLARVYGMNILNSVPPNSVLISVADNSNSSVYYLHYVEGERPDLEIYDPVKTYRQIRKRLGVEPSPGKIPGLDLCLKMIAANPEKSYVAKEHVLRGNIFDYRSLPELTARGMVYQIGSWPMSATIWDRLEIPYFDDPATQLEIKALTMLCNLYLARGEDLQVQGDTAKATRDFLAASNLVSNTMEASLHNSLGVFFRHKRRHDMAEKEYALALESRHLTANEKANILVNLGNLRKDQGDFNQAIEYYNQSLETNAENKDGKYNLALTHAYMSLSRRDYLTAARSFEEALSVSASDPRLIYNVGVLYDRNIGDTVRAIYNYEMFARMAPGLEESRAALARVRELRGLPPSP